MDPKIDGGIECIVCVLCLFVPGLEAALLPSTFAINLGS